MRAGGRLTRLCADSSVAAGCGACAARTPCGAVCARVPAAGNEKTPAKANNIAAVLIRLMTPTQTCCRPQGLRLARERQLQALPENACKPVCTTAEHALNRRNVDFSESALACRDGSHGARYLRAPAERLSRSVRGRDHPRRRFSDRRGPRRDAGGERIRPARPVPGYWPAVPHQ